MNQQQQQQVSACCCCCCVQNCLSMSTFIYCARSSKGRNAATSRWMLCNGLDFSQRTGLRRASGQTANRAPSWLHLAVNFRPLAGAFQLHTFIVRSQLVGAHFSWRTVLTKVRVKFSPLKIQNEPIDDELSRASSSASTSSRDRSLNGPGSHWPTGDLTLAASGQRPAASGQQPAASS